MATEIELPPIVQGDDWAYRIRISDEDGGYDITNDKFFFTLKTDKDDTDDNAQLKHDEVVGASQDATDGIHYLTVPRALTKLLDPISHYFDIQWLNADVDKLKTIAIGTVEVQQQITIREA